MALVVPGSPAAAQVDCLVSSRTYETFPGAMASRVALDAPIRVRLRDALATPLSPAMLTAAITVQPQFEGGSGAALAGTVEWIPPDTVSFQPSQLLRPETRYRVTVGASLLGVNTAFDFTSGERVDQGPPLLDLDRDTVIIESRELDGECEVPPGSFLVDMALLTNPVTVHPVDDADDGAVEYYAFLSRASGLSAPRFLARTRRPGQAYEPVLRFVLADTEVRSPVCVVIQAYDGVLNKAEQEPEICFDPITEAFFQPMCAISTPGSRPRTAHCASHFLGLLAFLVSCGGMLARRGRRARPRGK